MRMGLLVELGPVWSLQTSKVVVPWRGDCHTGPG